jgi:hypothetical protein
MRSSPAVLSADSDGQALDGRDELARLLALAKLIEVFARQSFEVARLRRARALEDFLQGGIGLETPPGHDRRIHIFRPELPQEDIGSFEEDDFQLGHECENRESVIGGDVPESRLDKIARTLGLRSVEGFRIHDDDDRATFVYEDVSREGCQGESPARGKESESGARLSAQQSAQEDGVRSSLDD